MYERLHIGYGDGIMLRPAIIANMQKYPERHHLLHIHASAAPMFADIEGLEIVSIIEPYKVSFNRDAYTRLQMSEKLLEGVNITNCYKLSSPCAEYETVNAPFEMKKEERKHLTISKFDGYLPRKHPKLIFRKEVVNRSVPTGNVITKSRQEIFCEAVGVRYSNDNYNITFTDEEQQVAYDFLGSGNGLVGIQMKSSTRTRDYDQMEKLVDHVASKANAVVTFDKSWRYRGRRSNVLSFLDSNIRNVWSVISRMSLFIGPDSFGVHAAGSLGIKTYGIFGPTDPLCRLKDYKNAAWSGIWKMPIIRRGLKLGCGRQYCWYKPCRKRLCLNARTPQFYFSDAVTKLGVKNV